MGFEVVEEEVEMDIQVEERVFRVWRDWGKFGKGGWERAGIEAVSDVEAEIGLEGLRGEIAMVDEREYKAYA